MTTRQAARPRQPTNQQTNQQTTNNNGGWWFVQDNRAVVCFGCGLSADHPVVRAVRQLAAPDGRGGVSGGPPPQRHRRPVQPAGRLPGGPAKQHGAGFGAASVRVSGREWHR